MNVYDDVVSYEENLEIHYSLINHRKFWYGEKDRGDTPVTGMVYDFVNDDPNDQHLLNRLKNIIFSRHKNLQNQKLIRSYVNLFFPSENPFFHTDGKCTTCLFYFNPQYNLDEGGETQFLIDDKIMGVIAIPSRLVIFNGEIPHKATTFRNNPRITVALKFSNVL